ncbi:uncharacterized protein E0L32_011202 [Thyridium curvatum]|uniref:DUF221-domain-containing protein n=1 Tax=Thyridium curvatum TaxID=1093900 RepID=A0A507BNK1_9PEZI|nr:uncharacterized protein E0L32_011202 [Thyridium curvatum]TPX19129.1 hypothetical protein E0L32_011202 [Thyridium curvatum]
MDIPFELLDDDDHKRCNGSEYVQPGTKDIQVQLVISLALGISAFVIFCILRPRWKSLYAARRRQLDSTNTLPHLPDSFFGWMPALYKITEEQVLSAAGLDAFVFLSFFKMAIRLFAVMFLFAAVVLEPVNEHYNPDKRKPKHKDASYLSNIFSLPEPAPYIYPNEFPVYTQPTDEDNSWKGYFWAYLVFVYFFTLLTMWFTNSETFKIIKTRQHYLGTQSTITDRTFRLSGIPKELRSEEKIKDLVEKLEIGHVDRVTLCRDWKELDDLVAERGAVLHKLEETWSVYLAQKPVQSPPQGSSPRLGTDVDVDEEAGENGRLLPGEVGAHQFVERDRPRVRVGGFLGIGGRKVDGIDYYEERLRQLDDKIRAARKKDYKAVGFAFVTMDSIASCQMAIQALVDPRPGQLLTKLAPSPTDVVWRNTYAPRMTRRLRSWLITVCITVLSIVWLAPVASLATLLSLCTIRTISKDLADSLERHEITKALVQTGLPTAVVSLLNVAVPYLYDWLSNLQGMIGQGDVELSVISKNFFFTFFNIFLVFTVFGTATNNYWSIVKDSLRDTTKVAYSLANEIQRLNFFYINFIMLQGVGLFPFRLLEFGSVALYPIYRMGAKTPRDFRQIMDPPVFSYGFYLPTALLVFILCLVYSVLPRGYLVLLLGIVYFTLGYFTYKYQLLYAMDQPQHATGGAWRIICYRIILGLVVFQLTMSGYLGLNKAFVQALLVAPLLIFTLWYSYYFRQRFEPLTQFIALRSIHRGRARGDRYVDDDEVRGDVAVEEGAGDDRVQGVRRRGSTVDEDREKGLSFVNPSLVVPLEGPWIYHDPPPLVPQESDEEAALGVFADEPGFQGERYQDDEDNAQEASDTGRSNTSSVSLGDTHIWRSED